MGQESRAEEVINGMRWVRGGWVWGGDEAGGGLIWRVGFGARILRWVGYGTRVWMHIVRHMRSDSGRKGVVESLLRPVIVV
jgi:hypothetical protein